jgi:hypothetical protein
MEKFPKDIIILILQFDGRIKYRRGKYINCISENDYRYNILSKLIIPTPVMYTMEYDCTHPEHFEYSINFNEKYELSVWNVYNPPNKIKYFFYKVNDLTIFYEWFRK